MSYQVIRQPNSDLFGIFSTETDTFVAWDATHHEVEDFFVKVAIERARCDARRIVDLVAAGQERQVYDQFAMTWETAARKDYEFGGEMTAGQKPVGPTA